MAFHITRRHGVGFRVAPRYYGVMTIFYLIRHGAHGLLDKAMAGRSPGVHLNEVGRREAERLGVLLAGVPFTAIYASPLERTQETAAPIARSQGLTVQIEPALHELDFGDWTGCTLDDLRNRPNWRIFSSFRSGTRLPGGETIAEVQIRMIRFLTDLAAAEPEGRFALFGHGDPIKSALAYYLGIPLDFLQRLEVRPATVSILELRDWGPSVLQIGAGIDAPATVPGRTGSH